MTKTLRTFSGQLLLVGCGNMAGAMLDRWLANVSALGAHGACLGTGDSNPRAVRFYRAYGFHEIERFGDAEILFGIALPR